jgi:hypothetical protein
MNQQLLDTGSWVDTSDEMLQSEEIRGRVSEFLVEDLVSRLHVEQRLSETGPAALARVAVRRTERHAAQLAERAFATPRFEAVWRRSNRAAHRELLRILDEEGSGVRAERGTVVIDLHRVVREISGELGIPGLGSEVPPGAGRLTVLHADQLSTAQSIVGVVRKLLLVTILVVLVLYALCLFLAGPRRPRALLGIGLSLALAGGLALLVRALAGDRVVVELVPAGARSVRPAAGAAWDIASSSLVTYAVVAIALGALVALGSVVVARLAPVR